MPQLLVLYIQKKINIITFKVKYLATFEEDLLIC